MTEYNPKISKGMTGKHHTQEAKKKISDSNKASYKNGRVPWCKGKTKYNNESLKQTSNKLKGRKITWNKKMSDFRKGKTYEEIHGEEMGKYYRKMKSIEITGRKHSTETKKKMRKSAIKYLKNSKNFNCPRIGKNEKQILDIIESKIPYKIQRQHPLYDLGYFVDGYCKENNTVYEVDEHKHYDLNGNLREKDANRQKEIEDQLRCNFLRIKDFKGCD